MVFSWEKKVLRVLRIRHNWFTNRASIVYYSFQCFQCWNLGMIIIQKKFVWFVYAKCVDYCSLCVCIFMWYWYNRYLLYFLLNIFSQIYLLVYLLQIWAIQILENRVKKPPSGGIGTSTFIKNIFISLFLKLMFLSLFIIICRYRIVDVLNQAVYEINNCIVISSCIVGFLNKYEQKKTLWV